MPPRATKITDAFKAQKASAVAAHGKAKAHVVTIANDDDDAKLEDDLHELKTFDLTMKYGPCIGLTRLERFDRAEAHGLSPPKKVLEIIHRRGDDAKWTECLWYGTRIT